MFEIKTQIGGVLIAQIAFRLETFRDDSFQLGRRLNAQSDGLRRARTLDHFVEHQAEAPDVGAVVHFLAARLLRCHVGGCSHHDALPGAGHRGHVGLECGRSHLGQAEIEHLHAVARGDEDIGGFDVAVDDARAVRRVERVGHLDAHIQHRVQAQRAPTEAILQRRALQVLHGDERSPVLFADVVDGADVGVVERRCGAGLALKTAQRLGITRQFSRDELERNGTVQAQILGLVHHAHAAAAEPRDDAVVRERPADQGIDAGLAVSGAVRPGEPACGQLDGRIGKKAVGPVVCGEQRAHLVLEPLVAAARVANIGVALARWKVERGLQQPIDVIPALSVHGQ